MKTRIHAFLKTRSPLHIAHPNNGRMNDAGQLVYGPDGFPCTTVQKLRVANGTGMIDLPVIAANNLAGRLRRRAAKMVLDAVAAKGEKVSLHAYSVLMCGASTGKPDSEDMTYQEYVSARDHVYFGLFGGGPKMFERKVRVHNALPVTQQTIDLQGSLAHPNAADHIVAEGRMTAVWGFRRVDDLRDLTNIDLAEATVDNFHSAFQERQGAILADKGAEDKSRASTKGYSALEFVVPGVVFGLTFELDLTNPAQFGLFLHSLDALARDERLGGYTRNGFGAFSLEDVMLVDEESGETSRIFQNGKLDVDAPMVSHALEAWVSAAAQIDASVIENVIAVSEASVAKQAKKTAAKEAKKATATA